TGLSRQGLLLDGAHSQLNGGRSLSAHERIPLSSAGGTLGVTQIRQPQQQKLSHFPQAPLANDVSGGKCQPHPGTNVNMGESSAQPQPHLLQMRSVQLNQSPCTTPVDGATQPAYMERQDSNSDSNRAPAISSYTNKEALEQHLVCVQESTNKEQNAASSSPMKHKTFEQAPAQQYKSQLSYPEAPLATPIGQKNAISGIQTISLSLLFGILKPQLDKDKEMQLQTLSTKFMKNEIARDQFIRLMRNIIGDQTLRLALLQWQSQSSTNNFRTFHKLHW
ncbi:hypothetical protein Tsubulata_012909, partial [Turnera subulata]